MFTESDHRNIKQKGISINEVIAQINRFEKGFEYASLVKPATVSDGILRLSEGEQKRIVGVYDAGLKNKKIVKFVPASGAASRMFKSLYNFLEEAKKESATQIYLSNNGTESLKTFITRLKDFAFAKDLKVFFNIDSIESDLTNKAVEKLLLAILTEEGLNYGNLPKGLLKFHKYSDEIRTSFEEHLIEGARYSNGTDGFVRIHLTVSPEHKPGFAKRINDVLGKLEDRNKVKYDISFSIQKPSTDTIAVDNKNEPFRTATGELLFRPGGHGALIGNLNDIEADVVFIKNIDNVVHESLIEDTIIYKKVLAGVLFDYQQKIFEILKEINSEESISKARIYEIVGFIKNDLCYKNDLLNGEDVSLKEISRILDRPLRVCGMVQNEDEPGGGPFWVRNSDGSESLQIVEGAQVNTSDNNQLNILKSATHFNPVDLVCSAARFNGQKFNLMEFVDPNTAFISTKSQDGRELKALELPGLWNGAMANWNTVFVEVPISTFNPVKTVFDLLRKGHQGNE